jgi:hypothetical protein
LSHEIEVVEDRQVLRRVAQLAERREHVLFGLPIFSLHLLGQILVDLGGTDRVEKGEDFEFLFHYLVRLNLPVKR